MSASDELSTEPDLDLDLKQPGLDQPDLADFLAPIEPRKSRQVLLSVVAGVTVLAMVAVAVTAIFV